VSRIIDVFPANHQAQIRVQLAMSLLAVISQVLLPLRGAGADDEVTGRSHRVAGLELMMMTPAIANLIRQNEINRIQDVIQTSRSQGMFTLDDHLAYLVQKGFVEKEDVLAYALDPGMLERRLAGP